MPTLEEIEAARTPGGGWTREQLAAWGVEWPPHPGWKAGLVALDEMKRAAARLPGIPGEPATTCRITGLDRVRVEADGKSRVFKVPPETRYLRFGERDGVPVAIDHETGEELPEFGTEGLR